MSVALAAPRAQSMVTIDLPYEQARFLLSAVGTDETRAVLTQAFVSRADVLGGPALCTTDGHRLHAVRVPADTPEGFVIPGTVLKALCAGGKKRRPPVRLCLVQPGPNDPKPPPVNQVCTLYEGKPHTKWTLRADVVRKLADGADNDRSFVFRASGYPQVGVSLVGVSAAYFPPGPYVMAARLNGGIESDEETGEPVGLCLRYLEEAVALVPDDFQMVRILCGGATDPVAVTSGPDGEWYAVVMPMRL